eukprot:Skav219393  [mRNA]  locus=scaffold2133:148901:149176:+ [translate_table: standard]
MTAPDLPMADDLWLDQQLWTETGVSWQSESSTPELPVGKTDSGAVLSLTLEPQLLRATLPVALSGFGRHWEGFDQGTQAAAVRSQQPGEVH